VRQYYVYILASLSKTLYVGVTNDIQRRVGEHKDGTGSRFTSLYRIDRLVHLEETPDILAAITRE
jgi:putative endonuclease